MNTPRSLPPSPPARGSFPLDHAGQCKAVMQVYLDCMKQHRDEHHLCKDHSRAYLACRMESNLMAKEDLNTMGFGPESRVVMGKHEESGGEEVIAGIAAAKRKTGIIFGIGGGSTPSKS
jgi:cytochrome c oxidase assembly protein subunit 19